MCECMSARTPCMPKGFSTNHFSLTETSRRLSEQRLLVHLPDHGGALLVANLKVEVKGERPTDQVGGEFVGVGPDGLAVLVHVGFHVEAPAERGAGDQEFGFGDFDSGAHAAAHAEAVVAH